MATKRVALVGATGETGSSILDGLLASNTYSIVALIRPASFSKPTTLALQERGVATISIALEDNLEALVKALSNIDILISAISPFEDHLQFGLADAAKVAGVKRFVPNSFTAVTPTGIAAHRDEKEKLYAHLKNIKLPYTIIDVGWWYQASVPRLPSGKLDSITKLNRLDIAGQGNVPSAITDKRDVGKYVAHIIQDDRTINRYVMAYSEIWTPNQIYDLFDELSGEKTTRNYVSEEVLEQRIVDANNALQANPADAKANWTKISAQMQLSIEVRGNNTPDTAKALGYLLGKELYPNLNFYSFRAFAQDMLDGKGVPLYESNVRIANFLKQAERAG